MATLSDLGTMEKNEQSVYIATLLQAKLKNFRLSKGDISIYSCELRRSMDKIKKQSGISSITNARYVGSNVKVDGSKGRHKMQGKSSELATFANIAHVKGPLFRDIIAGERLLQLFRRFKDVFFSEHPRAPVHSQGTLALRVLENVHRVLRIRVHGAHDVPGVVCSYGNQT